LLDTEMKSPRSRPEYRTVFLVGLSSAEWMALSVGLARQRDAVWSVGLLAEKGSVSQSGLLGREMLSLGRIRSADGL
jgi:hypothetical protein